MLSTKTLSVNGKSVEFINNCRGNRSGFVHESQLNINGCYYGENKVQYYNRTWECYQYQSVMKGLVYNLEEKRTKELKDKFLEINGWSKLTASRKPSFNLFIVNDEDLNLYKEIYKAL